MTTIKIRTGSSSAIPWITQGFESENVVPLIKQNTDKSLVLMEGYDLRTVLAYPLDLRSLLQAKISALNLESEPYFSVSQFLRS